MYRWRLINKFKVWESLHNIKICGDAACADTFATEQYPIKFAILVDDGGHGNGE